MSDLHGFDGLFQLSEAFLVKLATVIENKFADALQDAELACSDVDIAERVIELGANRLLLIPRMLFATRNPNYMVAPDATLEDRLLAHRSFGELDEPRGVGSQPNRLVFLRDEFYTLENPPLIQLETDQVRIPIRGSAYLGRRFRTRSDGTLLGEIKSGIFEMDLIYRVEVIDAADKGLSFQRHYSVVDTLAARAAGVPTLPPCELQVYALNNGTQRNPVWILPPLDTPPDELQAAGLSGLAGDEIFERPEDIAAGAARFQLRSAEVALANGDTTLRLQMVDLDGPVGNRGGVQCVPDLAPDVVAQPLQGHISLVFDRIENLVISGMPGEVFDPLPIGESLVRENPFGSGVFDLNDHIPTDLFAQFEVMGSHGLDAPLFPKVFPLSFDSSIEPGETFVSSTSQTISFSATKVIANDALVLAGMLHGGSGNIAAVPSSLNLPDGGRADIAMALSDRFLQTVILDRIVTTVNEQLEAQEEIDVVFGVTATFKSERIEVAASGSGTKKDVLLGFDLGFSFHMDMPIRLQLQNAIARDTFEKLAIVPIGPDGLPTVRTERVRLPIDAWGEPIPEWVFRPTDKEGLGIVPPRFELPAPDRNPVCFLGFCDPEKLAPPQLYCDTPVEANPPIRYNEDGTERPPDPSEPGPGCHRQSDFEIFPELTHVQEIGFVWPGEDEINIQPEANTSIFGFVVGLIVGLIVALFTFGIGSALGGLSGAALTSALIASGVGFGFGFTAGFVISNIKDTDIQSKVGDKVSDLIADALATVSLTLNPSIDLHIGLVSYVVNISMQAADSNDNNDVGALIYRSRVIVETQDERTGLEGLLDDC